MGRPGGAGRTLGLPGPWSPQGHLLGTGREDVLERSLHWKGRGGRGGQRLGCLTLASPQT